MQATRGFAGSVPRGRLIGCCMAVALAIGVLVAPSAASAVQPPVTEQYLALGDSLAFGYSSQLYHEGEAAGYDDPEGFEHGYVNQFLKTIKGKAVKNGKNIKLVNDGCPGETTESLIGPNSSLLATLNAADKAAQEANGLPPVTGENPCAYQAGWNAFKKVGVGGPLHHPYSGSQLEDAIATIANATNVEHKPVTTITLNIGANDELHSLGKVEAEAKAFVEAKVAKVGKEAVEAKLAKIGKEAVEAKLAQIGKEAVEAKLKVVAENAVKAKLAKVAAEAIETKVGEAVLAKCEEKAYFANGESFEEPGFKEKTEECLFTEGKALGEAYFAENQAQLEKEGEEAAGAYYFENKAQLEKEGEEAAGVYYFEHKAQLNKEGEEAAFAYYVANKAKVEKEGEEAAFAYFAANKAKVEQEGKEAAEKYFAEHAFELSGEGEAYGSELVIASVPGLFKQINSNIAGILTALRSGGSLGLDGGKAVNYTGKIVFQGGYNPFGKLFHFAFEGVKFVEEHGGLGGPFGKLTGRCGVRGKTFAEEKAKIEGGCTASEAQAGFTGLVKALNKAEYETVHGGFLACMSFPQANFNNGSQTEEPERLGKWVNMLNFSESNGKVNGPDIHPTPEGYVQLGKEMVMQTNGKCKKEGLPGF
jgi:hypothetical protein